MPIDFRVLVASADVDVLDLFSRRLVVLGCRPVVATQPAQVLAAVIRRHFHLAFVTPKLEGGCGLKLVLQLSDRTPNLPIWLVGRSSDELADVDVPVRSAARCTTIPRSLAGLDAFLEDAVESACAADRASVVEPTVSRKH